ncbi:MAG: hypothetical protein WC076_13115 [Terrimicrobiaceae bacterium]|nr:hypothetical protein [Terrimicrobiaceae bacterium]
MTTEHSTGVCKSREARRARAGTSKGRFPVMTSGCVNSCPTRPFKFKRPCAKETSNEASAFGNSRFPEIGRRPVACKFNRPRSDAHEP